MITQNDFDIRPGDIVTASFEKLATVAQDWAWRAFTWDKDPEPVIVDAFTASAMVKVHDALGEANQAKFRRMIGAGRGSFVRLVDFTWQQVA